MTKQLCNQFLQKLSPTTFKWQVLERAQSGLQTRILSAVHKAFKLRFSSTNLLEVPKMSPVIYIEMNKFTMGKVLKRTKLHPRLPQILKSTWLMHIHHRSPLETPQLSICNKKTTFCLLPHQISKPYRRVQMFPPFLANRCNRLVWRKKVKKMISNCNKTTKMNCSYLCKNRRKVRYLSRMRPWKLWAHLKSKKERKSL